MNNELIEKIDKACNFLKAMEPKEGFYLAFSGGKDSCVCKDLLIRAGCKFDAHYRVTSVDPPELVRFIKEFHTDVEREVPRYDNGMPITMWNLIPKKMMPPTRIARYCCEKLKESGGDGRMCVTGVRWEESYTRKNNNGLVNVHSKVLARKLEENEDFRTEKHGGVVLINDNDDSRRLIESCYTRHKTTVNPIIFWTEKEVWEYIREFNIPYCKLYDEGFHRLGCIGCPMARRNGREKEFARWPKYKAAYLRAFEEMLKVREAKGKIDGSWRPGTTPEDIYHWWMEDGVMPGQISIFEDME